MDKTMRHLYKKYKNGIHKYSPHSPPWWKRKNFRSINLTVLEIAFANALKENNIEFHIYNPPESNQN